MIRNPHTLEDSWWDGPERFQYVNRNVIAYIQNEDLFKFTKTFAPKQYGLHIGGWVKDKGIIGRANWIDELEPLTLLLDIDKNKKTDIYADAKCLPFPDGSLGYIVSFHVFEHIKEDLNKVLQEWLRVLMPGGLLALSMPDKRCFLHDPAQVEEGRAAYHEMTPAEAIRLFKDLNVDILLFNSRNNNFDFDILVRKK